MTNKNLKTSLSALVVAMVLPWQSPAIAHNATAGAKGGELKAMATHASLIARGRVIKVEYRLSEKTEQDAPLPHVFVTYALSDVIRGKVGDETLTLRFIGGPDGSGDILEVSGVPAFEQGEEDLLFIKDNGTSTCPLVGCEWGRFRIHEGGVYNTHGSPVRAVDKNNVISRGEPLKEFRTIEFPSPTFDGLMKNKEAQAIIKEMGMSMDEARERYDREAPKTVKLTKMLPERAPSIQTDKYKDTTRPVIDGKRLQKVDPDLKQLKRVPQIQRDQIIKPGAPRLDNELQDGPISVEEFVDIVKRASEGVSMQKTEIKSVSADKSFTPIALKLAAAQDHRTLKMAGPAKPDAEELKEMKEHGDLPTSELRKK